MQSWDLERLDWSRRPISATSTNLLPIFFSKKLNIRAWKIREKPIVESDQSRVSVSIYINRTNCLLSLWGSNWDISFSIWNRRQLVQDPQTCRQVHCKSCICKSHGKDPFGSKHCSEGPCRQQTFLRRTLKFGIKRHSEGLFWKGPAARGNHWPRVLQNWHNHPMIMTWRNCVWDQLNLKLICVLKRMNLVSPLYYCPWHKTSKAWFMPSFLFKISTSYGLAAGSFMM